MLQRAGYPNISIKLYQNYDAWLENRFIELAATFTTLTIRDGLMNGINEGLLQIYDANNLQTKIIGDEIIQISLKTANTEITYNRLYGIKHAGASVDMKGDNIITFQLGSLHYVKNLKFSRMFTNNANVSVKEMLDFIYRDMAKLTPKFENVNTRVPMTNWVLGINEYFEFIRKYGQTVINENIPLVWEDMTGMHISDFRTLQNTDPIQYVVTEPKLLGETIAMIDEKVCFDFEWLTKANGYTRNPYKDVSFYAHSFIDKRQTRVVTGDGHNSVAISRSGAYYDQVDRSGKEEYDRMLTFAQYDAYCTAKTYGEFGLVPGMKLEFFDKKNQFMGEYYVDEVIHEISREQSITNMYMFNNSAKIDELKERQIS
ncbi:baseplate central spike complex protein [Aeromonas phage B614]|nr:baseplate central spike complex protein [Aeromonas phage B614]UYD58282.1 baseplate central spike complex protein [Aeromonas phage UP87]UYD58396.1 baseplate central spike complex protein [Aeromonas phage avDM14-QBC]UYD58612.1 baseplate central spike complex protein [Aeromonas phage avDM10-HWA]UYD59085.1 baseplate central spike complex protein [Aeromonas phage avDM7-IJDJ]UYD59897.1 baseplate central spike complex protein [Aeromonas phage avDM9-HANS]